METPLQPVYQALMYHQTTLAWQELLLALQPSDAGSAAAPDRVSAVQWRPVFQQILNQSDCGRRLTDPASQPKSAHDAMRISLLLQNKMNLRQEVHQIKISIDGVSQPVRVALSDRRGKLWLSGLTRPVEAGYTELESQDWFQPVPEGEYQLKVGRQIYPLILATEWQRQSASPITFDHDPSSQSPFVFSAPPVKQVQRCQTSRRLWQWLDHQYELIAPMEAVQVDVQSRGILPANIPERASWLSAVVAERYFQGNIEIEKINRVTLPVRYLPMSQK
nr:DUF2861 family protein [Photobacterium galatheae]